MRLCLLLLALLLVGAHATRPKVVNATVQIATGSLAGNDVTLAEFEAIFDQNLHLLEVTDCVDTGCVPNNTACACDYTSKDPALCGVSPTGCQCDKSFCDTTVVDDWIPIQIGVPYRGKIPFAFSTQQLRLYLPIKDSCKALHIRLTQHSGDTDLYVTNDLTNPPTGGPYLAVDTLANLGYANNQWPGGFPWFSFRSKGDQTILCPGERWNNDSTIDNYQPGTYYIQVQTYSYPGDYTIYTYLYDIVPNWNLSQALANKWPVPVDCAVTKQQYPTHHCLGEDELVGSKDWVTDYPDADAYYVKQMEGPCPHVYAFVGMDGPATNYQLYARPTGIDPNFTFVDDDDGLLANRDGLIVMDDFNRGYVAFSVCPAVGDRSTVFFLVRRLSRRRNQWYRRFFTINPNRFRATPLSQIGPLSEQSFVTLETIDFKTTDGQPVPDVSDPNGIIFPCTYEGGGQCRNLYVTVTAATNESTPMFPPPMASRRNVLPGQTFPEPAFLAAENISARNDSIMRATLLISLDYTNGFHAARLNAVPRDAIARLQFRFPNYRLVNDKLEAAEGDSWRSPINKKAECSIDEYNTVLQSIGATEEGLASAQTLPGLNDQLSQIDYLAWRPAYLGCDSLAQSLLNNFTNTIVIDERNCLSNQPGAVSTHDPCCFNLFNWGQCCLAKPTLITVSTFQPTPTADALQGACGDGANCVYTYLEDYARSTNAVCRPQLSEKIYKESYAFWVACTDQVFGQYLRGRNCTTDADCTTIGSTPSNSSYCEFTDVYQKWTPDPEQRKYGQCVTPYPDLVDAFLDCFIEQGSLLSILVLENFNVTGSTTVELRNNLKKVPSLLSADCNANTNAAFAPLDPDSSSDMWTGQTHWIWNINGANLLCDSTRSPKMLHGSPVYLSFFEAPLSCWRAGLQNDVGSIQTAVIRSSSQADCEGVRVCNYGDYAAFYGSDAATLGAQCNSTYTQSCAVCRPDGTHCQTVPAAVVAANGGACPAQVCFNVDGSMTLPSNGACPPTCTVPCRDAGYNPIPCPDQQACEAAGRCTDEGVFVNTNGTDGACLTEGNPYHKPSCLVSAELPRLSVLDVDAGCVFRRDNATRCATRSGNPRWIPRSARSQAECEAYGCGCTKPAVAITELGQLITAVSSVPASPAECDACGSAACKPYFSWIPGRWVVGTLHSAAVVAPQVVAPFTWRASTFDFTKLSAKLESTILFLYSQQTKSSAQCRFNKIAPSIQAVSLACTTNPEIDQIRNIQNELPIGVGVPCGGAALEISAPPNTIYFRPDSVTPLGYCPTVQIFNVPADSFGSAASSKQLSTYFTKKRRGAQGRTLEFANAKGALIGQVLASGIRITPDNATLVASRVRLCLNGGVQIAALDKKFERYGVFDIAEQQGGFLVPLRVNVTNDATLGQCAELPRVTAATYVPVIRLEGEFEKVEPPKLTKGEKTILFLACAAYFITAAYAIYHMVLIVLAATLIPFYLLPPFWMASMLALANTIRGIYFALIGSEQIAESNVADIILFELPTFMWFTATTLVVLLWISIGSARKQKEIGPKFRVLFLVSNGLMYLLFILFVVLFSVLKDKKKVDKICGDRLPVKFDRTQREVLFIVYQCFLAVVALLLSAAFLFGGIKLIKLLRSSKKNPNAPLSADELKLLMLAIVCGLSFAAHAVFVFVLAIVQPGIAYLVVILVVLECLPSAYLLFNLPTRTKQASGTGSTSASGSATSAR